MSHPFRLPAAAGLAAIGVLLIVLGLARNGADLPAAFHLFLFLAFGALYVLPSALAVHRNCSATAWIIALNILLGWTLFGWVIALGWAAIGKVAGWHHSPPSAPTSALQGR